MQAKAKRTRRRHSEEFRAELVARCRQPGVSVSGIALAHGLNANLLRRWVKNHRDQAGVSEVVVGGPPSTQEKAALLVPVAITPPAIAQTGEIRIDIRRGATAIQMAWPVEQGAQLGNLLKDILS
jgi:transposase